MMGIKRPISATVDLTLRVSSALKRQIKDAAEHCGVSMNAVVIDLLKQSFWKDEELGHIYDTGYEALNISKEDVFKFAEFDWRHAKQELEDRS